MNDESTTGAGSANLAAREPITHRLKTASGPWLAVRDGLKTAEYRRDDRDFRVGDTLELIFADGSTKTPPLYRTISHILRNQEFGIAEGYALLSLAEAALSSPAEERGLRDGLRALRAQMRLDEQIPDDPKRAEAAYTYGFKIEALLAAEQNTKERGKMHTETWPAPAGTKCCTMECDNPATQEWEYVAEGTQRVNTQGCDEHGPDSL